MIYFLILFSFFQNLVSSNISSCECSSQDQLSEEREAVIELYKSLTEKSLWKRSDNWLKAFSDHCLWYGIKCDENKRIISISLRDNNLSGTIPSTISLLSELDFIDFSNNNLEGEVPSSFSSLKNLKYLNLSENDLQSFKLILGEGLANLESLDLSGNNLKEFPETQKNVTNKIKFLDVSNNKISSISSSIENLKILETLSFSKNKGIQISPYLWTLSYLIELRMSNLFASELSPSVSLLTSLEVLDISQNKISSLPSDLSSLSNLQVLNAGRNQLVSLPETLNSLQNLTYLHLPFNIITKNFLVLTCPKLKYLDLLGNFLEALDLREVIFKSLEIVHFSSPQFFPSSFQDTHLKEFGLYATFVKEFPQLPPTIEKLVIYDVEFESWGNQKLKDLLHFSITGQDMSVEFPLWIFESLKIQTIEIEKMNGTISTEIGLLDKLTLISITNGGVKGTIPTEIGNLQKLETFVLNGLPILSGSIPEEVSKLTNLKYFEIRDTNLGGKLGPSLSSLNNVTRCVLGENERSNFSCQSPNLLGGNICGLECTGETIQGVWMNEGGHCKQLEPNIPWINWFRSAFIIKESSYEAIFTVSLSCSQRREIIVRYSGDLELSHQQRDLDDPSKNEVQASMFNNKREILLRSLPAASLFQSACGGSFVSEEISDISEITCRLVPTSISLFSTSDCYYLNTTLKIDFTTQSLIFPFVRLFFQSCSEGASLYEDDTLRRWWNCSEITMNSIECIPQCGDNIILENEECDDG